MELKELKIDDKWSILYDSGFNDTPRQLLRYGTRVESEDFSSNVLVAMFYALLEKN